MRIRLRMTLSHFDVGADSSVSATTAKGYAVECYGSVKLGDGASITARTNDGDVDIIAYGSIVNYGAAIDGDVEALGCIHDKSAEQ